MCFSKLPPYLWSQDIEVSSPVGTTDELASVLGRDARVFGNPNNRGSKSVGVQVQAVECLTLLLTERLTWGKRQPQKTTVEKHTLT